MNGTNAGKFSRYRVLVADLARKALAHQDTEASADHVDVMLGVAPALMLLDGDMTRGPHLVSGFRRLGSVATGAATPMLADSAGDRRDVYFPFVLHLHLRAFARRYEMLATADWMACEDNLPGCVTGVREAENHADRPVPPQATARVLWQALCLAEYADVSKRDVDMELADAVVHQAVSRPGEHGCLHPASPDESPDAWTYRELTGLHALANLALFRRNRTWACRVEEIAGYHLEHTQPDFTTTQPWAIFAGLWTERTAMFAEQQLHDVTSAQATSSGAYDTHRPMVGMLLADAADALAQFDTAS